MASHFELKNAANGQFMFNLKAGNGEIILTSETYKSKESALNGIESVRKNAAGARLDDQTPQATGQGGKGKVERALERDWEQTKSDMPGLKGKNIKQNVTDTVRQASGEQRIPARNRQN